jgi:hydroxymethylpyrimidine pyrophosphatase-like HAD family hydrolase
MYGRSKAEIYDFIMEVGFDGIIGAGGGFVEIEGEMLYHHKVSDEDVRHMVDYFHEHDLDFYLESNGGLFASKNLLPHVAIEKLIQHLGISREDTIGIGDGMNDADITDAVDDNGLIT